MKLWSSMSLHRPNRQWRRRGGGLGGQVAPIPKSRQKLSKKNGIKLVGYTFRLENYVKIPPPHFSWIFLSWRRHCNRIKVDETVILEYFLRYESLWVFAHKVFS